MRAFSERMQRRNEILRRSVEDDDVPMRHQGDLKTFVLFMAPGTVLLLAFTYWPIVYTGYLSLHSWNLPEANPSFNGFANYTKLFNDPDFWRVVGNTVVYSFAVVLIAQTIAFAFAALIHQRRRQTVLRTIAFAPVVATSAATALAWVLLLHPRSGPLAILFSAADYQGPYWLESTSLALPAVILVGIWKEVGFASLFFLAGFQDLPREPFEAARLEGATAWERLRYVTVPLMSPVIFYLLLTGAIAAVKVFDTVAIMTEGGPIYPNSSTMVYHLYKTGFRDYRFGEASAIAMIFFVVLLGVTYTQLRAARRWVHTGN